MIAQCCSSGKRLLFSYFLNSLLARKRFIYHLILYHIITNLPTLRPPKAYLLHIQSPKANKKSLTHIQVKPFKTLKIYLLEHPKPLQSETAWSAKSVYRFWIQSNRYKMCLSPVSLPTAPASDFSPFYNTQSSNQAF